MGGLHMEEGAPLRDLRAWPRAIAQRWAGELGRPSWCSLGPSLP